MARLRFLLVALVPMVGVQALAATPGESAAPPRPAVAETAAAALRLPDGFTDSEVAAVPQPTALTWTPDGRMLVTSKPGRLFVVDDTGMRTTALDLSEQVCDDKERGLVGVAVDPHFEDSGYVYLYWTREVRGSCGGATGPNPANRVSRFVLGEDGTIALSSEKVLVDHIISPEGHHIAGDLEFGEDGLLYITVGDGVCSIAERPQCGPVNDNSQRLRLPHGKILRITRSGQPAAANPYVDVRGARHCTRPGPVPPGPGPCKEIFASGFRNPFRFARKPGTNTFYVNDVGLNTWEEVDLLRKGRNYGWNVREGHCRRESTTDCGTVRGFTNPIHDYRHTTCRSITGGAFVPDGVWPRWRGSYLYSDFSCGTIFRLAPTSTGGFRRSTFASGLGGPVHLRFGPHGEETALYYLSFFTDSVRRIARVGSNTPPVADFASRPDGLTVSFTGATSHDDDAGDTVVSWAWDFGDGDTTVTSQPTTAHTYATAGPVVATLTVTDSHGATGTTTRTVLPGEHPPALEITRPGAAKRFAVGDPVALVAQASDPEDGPLPGSAISWTVRLRHANHFHPYLGPVTGASVGTTYPAPEDIVAAGTSNLVAIVTATDSAGLTTTVRRSLLPRVVDLVFRTSPAGGRLVIQGEPRATPFKVRSWVGYVFGVRAPDQPLDGRRYVFTQWSDGEARQHEVTTPAEATTYVARYRLR
ncbi:PKD domain-containing protein [Nocardioides humilatus]|uniref:PKD domain-containing protein n=1 Tax=Nocardioides humilatus TaxID=2607660 RepID=A0A5B1LDM4_9ACTN|nr:PQQ-dependent sugar dehydrogenase [Nocardioides humilatus]KAA1417890.1 PKD domain-containing protein [Nocardioides humilatus]